MAVATALLPPISPTISPIPSMITCAFRLFSLYVRKFVGHLFVVNQRVGPRERISTRVIAHTKSTTRADLAFIHNISLEESEIITPRAWNEAKTGTLPESSALQSLRLRTGGE